MRSVCGGWRGKLALAALGVIGSLVTVSAEDWPFLRGPGLVPNGSVAETGLISDWPEAGPQVLWTYPLGQGYSSCVVQGERLCTIFQNPFGQYLLCLNVTTGQRIWEYRYAAPYDPLSLYPGPRSTPTIAGEAVYFTTPEGDVTAVTLTTGKVLWTNAVQARLKGQGAEFGYSASPLIWRGKVLVPIGAANAAIVALDAKTGQTVWENGTGHASYSTILPVTLDDRPLFVAYLQNSILIGDPETGEILWQNVISSSYDEHSCWPIFAEPYLVFSAPFRAGAQAYRLSWKTDATTQKLRLAPVWSSTHFSNDVISSIACDGFLYGFDLRDAQSKLHRPSRGEFRCLDLKTGAIQWTETTIGQATPVLADGKLWLFNDRGELIVAEPNPQQYKELARCSVFPDQVCWTAPTLANGRLFLRNHDQLVCLDIANHPTSATNGSAPVTETSTVTRRVAQLPRGRRWSVSWILQGERQHPFMRPTAEEYLRWFELGTLWALLPAIVLGACGLFGRQLVRAAIISTATLFLLGFLATPGLNCTREEFAFTWPAGLAAALQLAVLMSERLTRNFPPDVANDPQRRSAKRWARLSGWGLIAISLGYAVILHRLSLPHEWIFLVGLLPALLPAWLAARCVLPRPIDLPTPRRVGLRYVIFAIGLSLTYTTLFWSAAGLSLYKTHSDNRFIGS